MAYLTYDSEPAGVEATSTTLDDPVALAQKTHRSTNQIIRRSSKMKLPTDAPRPMPRQALEDHSSSVQFRGGLSTRYQLDKLRRDRPFLSSAG